MEWKPIIAHKPITERDTFWLRIVERYGVFSDQLMSLLPKMSNEQLVKARALMQEAIDLRHLN